MKARQFKRRKRSILVGDIFDGNVFINRTGTPRIVKKIGVFWTLYDYKGENYGVPNYSTKEALIVYMNECNFTFKSTTS